MSAAAYHKSRMPSAMIAIGIGAATLLIGCISGDGKHDGEAGGRRVVATIHGAPIYLDELQIDFERLTVHQENGPTSPQVLMAQRNALLQDTINRRLLLSAAEEVHVVIGLDVVEAVYQRVQRGWSTEKGAQGCTECTFVSELKGRKINPPELKRKLRETLIIRKYFQDHVFSRIAVTDKDIQNYILQNPEVLVQPEEVHALQIFVETKDLAHEIHRELRRGVPFEDLAIKHSISPEGKTGGDLGYFSAASMPAIFGETCAKLAIGQFSKVVEGNRGFHIFRVVNRRMAGNRSIDTVRSDTEKRLRTERDSRAEEDKIQELRALANIVIMENTLASLH